MKIDISMFDRVSVSAFGIRELTGRDSMDAMARAIPPGTDASKFSAHQVQTMHTQMLIAMSIDEVVANGAAPVQPVMPGVPYTAWEDWTTRTQEFVYTAYQRINGIAKGELDRFLEVNFKVPVPSTTTSSPSGPGSPGT